MRKSGIAWLGLVLLSMMLLSCPSPFSVSLTGQVVVDFGSPSARAVRALPTNIALIDIKVSAPDMETLAVTLNSPDFSATLDVPAGAARQFDVVAADSSGKVRYKGSSTLDIVAGVVHDLSVTMAALFYVSYDANGGDSGVVGTAATVPIDDTPYLAAASVVIARNTGNLMRSGYEFWGWNTAADGSGTTYKGDDVVAMPASDLQLFAFWHEVITYTVTFDSTGGSAISSVEVVEDTRITPPIPGPSRPHYAFQGWFKEAALTTPWDFLVDKVSSDITLYAKWLATKDILSFSITSPVSAAGVISGTDIAVTVPFGTIVTNMTPSVFFNGATCFPGPSTPKDFTNPVAYTITAEDGTTKVYTVTVTVALNNDAKLSMLITNPVMLIPTFQSTTFNYTGNATSSFPTIDVTPTASDTNADILVRMNGGTYTPVVSGSTLGAVPLSAVNGTNVLEVKITAEDGTTVQTYTVTIAKTVMVTITPGMGGTVASSGSGEYAPGQSIALNAIPDPGYRFVDWTSNGGAIVIPVNGTPANLTVPVTSPSTAIANFAPFNGGDGSVGTPYEIATLEQFKLMNSFRSSHFKLMTNLNLSSETNWLPIGDATTKFTGSFDGNGFGLDNLTINTTFAEHRGLFGYVDGAVISNVSLTNINFIDTFNYAGGLIGNTLGATLVTNCSVTGTMTAYQMAGGLIGQSGTGSTMTIDSCWTDVAITSDTYGALGGLVGRSEGGTIDNSYALGDISFTSASVDYVGGLVGWNQDTTITNCYAQGNVTGTNWVGGLVAYNSGTGAEDITKCYSTGVVTATAGGGGLVGGNVGAGIVTSSYYDTNTSGQSDNTGKGIPLSTALMKALATHASTYSGWDFLVIWDAFIDGAYPTLRP